MGICEGNFNKPFHEVRSCNPSTQGAEFKTRLVYTVNLRPVWDKQDFASTPLTLTLPSPIKSHKKKKLCHNRTKERTKWRNKREPSDKNFSRKKFNCTPIKSRAHMAKSLLKKEKKKRERPGSRGVEKFCITEHRKSSRLCSTVQTLQALEISTTYRLCVLLWRTEVTITDKTYKSPKITGTL